MGQESNEQRTAETVAKIDTINAIDGFNPMSLAIVIGDLNEGGGQRYHLPVKTQIAWFRLKYPEGRIAVSVKPGNNCFIAEARVYPDYKLPADCYLAEGSASRGISAEKATVSPREWAQTAAIGVALRNAGFGLQASYAGESFEDNALYEVLGMRGETLGVGVGIPHDSSCLPEHVEAINDDTPPEPALIQTKAEVVQLPRQKQSPLDKAMATPCPIDKHKEKTLGDMIRVDPRALTYIAKHADRYGVELADSARLICETALDKASA